MLCLDLEFARIGPRKSLKSAWLWWLRRRVNSAITLNALDSTCCLNDINSLTAVASCPQRNVLVRVCRGAILAALSKGGSCGPQQDAEGYRIAFQAEIIENRKWKKKQFLFMLKICAFISCPPMCYHWPSTAPPNARYDRTQGCFGCQGLHKSMLGKALGVGCHLPLRCSLWLMWLWQELKYKTQIWKAKKPPQKMWRSHCTWNNHASKCMWNIPTLWCARKKMWLLPRATWKAMLGGLKHLL